MALRGLLLCLMLFGASTVTASEQESLAAGPSPFVLIARLHALPNAAERVVALSRDVDAKVERGEPGMLLHTFDAILMMRWGLCGPRFIRIVRLYSFTSTTQISVLISRPFHRI